MMLDVEMTNTGHTTISPDCQVNTNDGRAVSVTYQMKRIRYLLHHCTHCLEDRIPLWLN